MNGEADGWTDGRTDDCTVSLSAANHHCTHKELGRFSWLPNLNFYRWKSENSRTLSNSNLVSLRFLSGSLPTLSIERNTSSQVYWYWIVFRTYLHSQVYIKKNLYSTPWITVSFNLTSSPFINSMVYFLASAFWILCPTTR